MKNKLVKNTKKALKNGLKTYLEAPDRGGPKKIFCTPLVRVSYEKNDLAKYELQEELLA